MRLCFILAAPAVAIPCRAFEGSATASSGPHSAGSEEFPSDNDARSYISSLFPPQIPSDRCLPAGREGPFRHGKRECPTVPLASVVIADLTSPQLAENDMLVDEYEQYPNEKTDVVVVSRSASDEPEPAPSAADRMFSFITLSPPLHRTVLRGACHLGTTG